MTKNVKYSPQNGDLWNCSRKSNVIRENYDDFSENVRKNRHFFDFEIFSES